MSKSNSKNIAADQEIRQNETGCLRRKYLKNGLKSK